MDDSEDGLSRCRIGLSNFLVDDPFEGLYEVDGYGIIHRLELTSIEEADARPGVDGLNFMIVLIKADFRNEACLRN